MRPRSLITNISLAVLLFSLISFSRTVYIAPQFKGFHQLTQISPDNNTLILVGDTQGRSWLEFWRENNGKKTPLLLAEIARQHPALVINLGDLVFCGSSLRQWKSFDLSHKPILDNNIPYFPIPGNHEYWCNHRKSFHNYFARFRYLNNRKWYSFQFRSIGFILFDSNLRKLTKNEASSQLRWYREELNRFQSSEDIRYIIVCCHNPPYTNSKTVKPSKDDLIEYVAPFQQTRKASLFFSGHCHAYERFREGDKYYIVSGGGGGPRQKLKTPGMKGYIHDEYKNGKGGAIRFLHFCRLDIETNRLRVTVNHLNNDSSFSVADTFVFPISEDSNGD